MANKKVDIFAVAKAARVSPSTVSRRFNHPDLVKPATRKRIDTAVQRLGYIRNRAAPTLHGLRSGTIGMIVPTIDHMIFAELIQSFSETVEEQGFTIMLASHGYDLDREYALIRKMLEHRVDGIALIGLEHSEKTTVLLARQNVATVTLWSHSQEATLPSIGFDNFEAGQLIGDHVCALGHRAIATLFPPVEGNDRAEHRFRGVLHALGSNRISPDDCAHIQSHYSIAAAKEAVLRLLSAQPMPTVILCGNDVQAWGAMHAIRQCGLSVPDDICVAGIGDFRGSAEFEPPLTTIRIPARRIGHHSGNAITRHILSPDTQIVHQKIDPELVVRTSTLRQQRAV